jgi:hypothetical protein
LKEGAGDRNRRKEERAKVFGYIDKEDSPRSLTYQLKLMKEIGFEKVDVLHKSSCFEAFGGIKTRCSQKRFYPERTD